MAFDTNSSKCLALKCHQKAPRQVEESVFHLLTPEPFLWYCFSNFLCDVRSWITKTQEGLLSFRLGLLQRLKQKWWGYRRGSCKCLGFSFATDLYFLWPSWCLGFAPAGYPFHRAYFIGTATASRLFFASLSPCLCWPALSFSVHCQDHVTVSQPRWALVLGIPCQFTRSFSLWNLVSDLYGIASWCLSKHRKSFAIWWGTTFLENLQLDLSSKRCQGLPLVCRALGRRFFDLPHRLCLCP